MVVFIQRQSEQSKIYLSNYCLCGDCNFRDNWRKNFGVQNIDFSVVAPGGSIPALLGSLIFLLILISELSMTVRRWHDLNKSGWWILLNFVPVINVFVLIYLLFWQGTNGENRFGDDPKSSILSV